MREMPKSRSENVCRKCFLVYRVLRMQFLVKLQRKYAIPRPSMAD